MTNCLMSGHHSIIFPSHAISQVHKQVGLVCHNIQVVSTWQSSNHMSAGTVGFPAEHFIIMGWLILFTSPDSGFNVVAESVTNQK